ncbi:hypothetical protein COEX109129_37770 [Corallococcus exiguus]
MEPPPNPMARMFSGWGTNASATIAMRVYGNSSRSGSPGHTTLWRAPPSPKRRERRPSSSSVTMTGPEPSSRSSAAARARAPYFASVTGRGPLSNTRCAVTAGPYRGVWMGVPCASFPSLSVTASASGR